MLSRCVMWLQSSLCASSDFHTYRWTLQQAVNWYQIVHLLPVAGLSEKEPHARKE